MNEEKESLKDYLFKYVIVQDCYTNLCYVGNLVYAGYTDSPQHLKLINVRELKCKTIMDCYIDRTESNPPIVREKEKIGYKIWCSPVFDKEVIEFNVRNYSEYHNWINIWVDTHKPIHYQLMYKRDVIKDSQLDNMLTVLSAIPQYIPDKDEYV